LSARKKFETKVADSTFVVIDGRDVAYIALRDRDYGNGNLPPRQKLVQVVRAN